MKRNNIVVFICLFFMIISLLGCAATVYYAKVYNSSNQMGPGNMGNNMGTPPTKPDENNTSSSNDSSTSDTSSIDTTQSNQTTPPTMPSGGMGNVMGENSNGFTYLQIGIIFGLSMIFAISLLYLFKSHFGRKSRQEIFINSDKKVIFAFGTLFLATILSAATIIVSNNYVFSSSTTNKENNNNINNNNTTSVTTKGSLEITEDKTISDKTYSSDDSDVSAIVASNGANLTLSNVKLTKNGNTSSTENSDFAGLNAALLAKSKSYISISDSTITTNGKGANAVFATGEISKIKLKNVTITTSADSSRGLDATYSGTIEADDVTITTSGAHCATVATDRGEGTVTVANSNLTTKGSGSPNIYSTGNITVTKTTGLATGSSTAVIEGKNSITMYSSDFTSYAYGRTSDGIDNTGVMIYQSTSGDASEGTGTFSATNSKITISNKSTVYKTAPMFFVTNTDAIINLTSTTLSYGSNLLLSVAGNDGEWGTEGSNGGIVTFNATDQTLTGNIEVDKISKATINLKNSTLTLTINSDNTAKNITLSIDEDSTWNVTGNSYITTLTLDDDNLKLIKDNGHTIYYDSSNNNWLNNKTVTLQNGGSLKPM